MFTQQDFEALSGLYVQPAWFARVDFPSGTRWLHTGMGPVEIGDHEWEGISDPFGGQLVGLGAVEELYFGQAPAVDVVMSGANREFLKSVWDDRHVIEGCACDLYFATFDAETGEPVVMFRRMMQGRLTAPRMVINNTSSQYSRVEVDMLVSGISTDGMFALQWAQNTSDAGVARLWVVSTMDVIEV